MDTPAFLLWALEYHCTVRGFEDGTNPERVERQLRAVRATSDAIQEGRVVEGVCVDPPDGFKFAEALQLYGGLPSVERACHGCPANARARRSPGALAGCYGLAPLPAGIEDSVSFELTADFPRTRPAWFGLWIRSPVAANHARQLRRVFAAIENNLPDPAFRDLEIALEFASEQPRRLFVVLYPPGRVAGRTWRLITHCPTCKAAWGDPKTRACAICGYRGPPAPDKKRQARGRRPYFPLSRLLGPAAAVEILLKYASQKPIELPDQPPGRPLPGLPSNRADD